MQVPSYIQRDYPLAPLTTLNVGGAAEYFVDVVTVEHMADVVSFARQNALPLTIIGGGSNVLVSDQGVRGVIARIGILGWATSSSADGIALSVGAGEDWNATVSRAVHQNWAGIECLTGIPGRVGAAPIQNIGAYGQEVSDVIERVTVYHVPSGTIEDLSADACEFRYRFSRFKAEDPLENIILQVHMKLTPDGPPALRYPELIKRLGDSPSLPEVVAAVRSLRASKSMLAGGRDENSRSAGSFFLNPILQTPSIEKILDGLATLGHDPTDLPRWQVEGGVKVPAAWLIERAGFTKGYGIGRVGLSSKHTLALVNRGGATATELLTFARHIGEGVEAHFGVQLEPEPRYLGFQ